MVFTVLGFGPVSNAVRERCLQTVELRASYVHPLVCNDPCQMLAHTLPHDACLAVIHSKSFLDQDGGNVNGKTLDMFFKGFVAGEGEVVGVARVFGSGRFRQASQATIHAIRTQICEGGRGWGTLWQVRD